MDNSSLDENESWRSGSFLLEMKPTNDLASLFVSLPSVPLFNDEKESVEPLGIMSVDDQSLEIVYDMHQHAEQTAPQSVADSLSPIAFSHKFGAKFVDLLLEPNTLCSPSWADAQQRLMMCKVRAEADCVTFAPKKIGRLEEELAQHCLLREYVERIEHNRSFHVKCRRCDNMIHSHSKGAFVFGVLPNDDWLDTAPQMDYFCAQSSDCCGAHLEMSAVKQPHYVEGILGFSTVFSADSSRHWLPGERKIVLSNSFILFQNTDKLAKELRELAAEGLSVRIVSCAKCNTQLGTSLKNHSNVFKLHLSMLHVYGDSQHRSAYASNRFVFFLHFYFLQLFIFFSFFPHFFCFFLIFPFFFPFLSFLFLFFPLFRSFFPLFFSFLFPFTFPFILCLFRFLSMESFFAWMILNKCEQHSSVKLIVRSLDRSPHLLIWLLEPYVLLTKGVLCPFHFPSTNDQPNLLPPGNAVPNDVASITFPALKVLYKCFDTFDSKQDPRANGCDSSVGILELPTDSCLQLTELLLSSSLALPPSLRALGQFYVGFIRMKDRID